ncbi:zinc finger protein 436 [Penaeus vannamei]|uniref:zinc finger protein 436 n=1 Tax=Penaeus vannamei TaxID=6689 RepID=UPI00387F9D3E
MEERSEGLRLWKNKLDDIVSLASQLQPEDHKVAAEIWFAALKQIQTLWSKAQLSPSRECVSELSSLEDVNSLSTRKTTVFQDEEHSNNNAASINISNQTINRRNGKEGRRDMFQQHPLSPSAAKKIKKEHQDPEEEVDEEDLQNVKALVKQEVMNGEESQRNSGDENENEVQSVHLMISADPVLVPNMSKFKKVQKSNASGKTETAYQCEKCPKQYRTPVALYKHRSTHTKNLECQICHQRLSNRHALNAHKRTHTGERPYECTKCSSRFTTRGNLARHIAGHEGKKPWQCDICGKRYTEKKSVKVHMRTHTGEKPYACSVCPKRFSQSGILQAHMLIHTDQYAHLCDVCGRSFRQRSQLITHHLRHEGVRPYSCTECERKFTTKGDMERHMRTHTGERPYHCDVCGSSFARPQTLQEHKNRHYNFKPYVCKICGKSFHELAACSRHVKGQHGREPAAASIIRLNSQNQQEGRKERILLTHVDEDDEENRNEDEDVDNDGEEDTRDGSEADKDEEGDIKHHIFVMHTADSEETKLITIAEQSVTHAETISRQGSAVTCEGCGTLMSSMAVLKNHARQCKAQAGVSVAEWLVHGSAGSPSSGMEITVGESGASGDLGCVEESSSGLECVKEVDSSGLSHAVTISEDGSITSVPLSQLAPLHLQLENDYMVVLSDDTRAQEATSSFQTQDLQQVDESTLTGTDSETSQPRITLVSSLLSQ